MTNNSFFRTLKAWAAGALAVASLALLPATAQAGLSASAVITPSQNGSTFHYDITLTNSGSTTVGTFWFAWIPGYFFLNAAPTNVVAPSGWSGPVTPAGGGFAIEWFANGNSSLIAPGASLSGFSFDSTESPADLTGPNQLGSPVVTSFVYSLSAGSAFMVPNDKGDNGFEFAPSVTNPIAPPPPAIDAAASVLPGGRSVQVGTTATIFATFANGGASSLTGCAISLPSASPAGLSIGYQTTNPSTNAITGTPNTPVTIAAKAFQTFVLSFNSSQVIPATTVPLVFSCSGAAPVTSITGVNTVDLLFSATPIADVIALAATASNDGILHLANNSGAFAVASDNAGAASTIIASADTGGASLPLSVFICQTTAAGACMAAPAASVTVSDTAGGTPTFSVFADSTGAIPLNAATSRIFVRFKDSSGASHGSTSVAVTTN
jgi:hypothetical protein